MNRVQLDIDFVKDLGTFDGILEEKEFRSRFQMCIKNKCDQLDEISTMYHEFTHMIHALLEWPDQPAMTGEGVEDSANIVVRDCNKTAEEKLCNYLEKVCKKAWKEYLIGEKA